MLKKSIKQARYAFQTMKLAVKASRMYGGSYPAVLSHALRVCNKRRFLPEEAFRLGLFDPALSGDELDRYFSRKNLTKIQKSLNLESWSPLLKDKSLFYRYCMALKVPIPRLYGIFVRGMAGWCFDSSIPNSRDDWLLLLKEKVCSEFVIKPNRGAFGEGVRIFCRRGGLFADSFGKSYSAEDIYSIMIRDSQCEGYVIQQRLKNHREILRLTDTEHLQTVRITTMMDANGHCHIIHTHFKLITGSGVTDGFHHGQAGNLQAMICPDNGILESAVTMIPDGSGVKTIEVHPKSGIIIHGYRLPLWPEACALVKETTPKFLPLRTIGWDVALTPSGPVIVEGNVWWDPPNHHRRMNEIVDSLLQNIQ